MIPYCNIEIGPLSKMGNNVKKWGEILKTQGCKKIGTAVPVVLSKVLVFFFTSNLYLFHSIIFV